MQKEEKNGEQNELIQMITKLLVSLEVTVMQEKDVVIEDMIAQGGFGKVFRGKYQDHTVAIKELQMELGDSKYSSDMSLLNEISNEINFVKIASNGKLPRFYGVILPNSGNGHLKLVLELIDGITLKDAFPSFNDEQKFEVILQLLEILKNLHSKHLIHS